MKTKEKHVMGDVEDGAFGKMIGWFIDAFLWLMNLFGKLSGRKDKK